MQLKTVPGLTVIQPRGAMYVMVGIDCAHFADIADDVDFSQKLLREQVRACTSEFFASCCAIT